MRLVHPDGRTVRRGDELTARDGTILTVMSIQQPHHAGSTGRVYVEWHDEDKTYSQGYFPSVFDLKWVDREDQ